MARYKIHSVRHHEDEKQVVVPHSQVLLTEEIPSPDVESELLDALSGNVDKDMELLEGHGVSKEDAHLAIAIDSFNYCSEMGEFGGFLTQNREEEERLTDLLPVPHEVGKVEVTDIEKEALKRCDISNRVDADKAVKKVEKVESAQSVEELRDVVKDLI